MIHEPPLSAPQTPQNAPISIIPSRPMLTTPLRSENIPPIAPKTSGVENANVWATRDGSKTALRFPVPDRVARIPEPDSQEPAHHGSDPEAAPAARERPDPEQRGDQADRDRPDDPTRLDRRNADQRGESTEDERDVACRLRIAEACTDRIVETLRPFGHTGASTSSGLPVVRSFFRLFQTERIRKSAPTKSTIRPWMM